MLLCVRPARVIFSETHCAVRVPSWQQMLPTVARMLATVLMSKISCALPVVQPASKVQHIRHKCRMRASNWYVTSRHLHMHVKDQILAFLLDEELRGSQFQLECETPIRTGTLRTRLHEVRVVQHLDPRSRSNPWTVSEVAAATLCDGQKKFWLIQTLQFLHHDIFFYTLLQVVGNVLLMVDFGWWVTSTMVPELLLKYGPSESRFSSIFQSQVQVILSLFWDCSNSWNNLWEFDQYELGQLE